MKFDGMIFFLLVLSLFISLMICLRINRKEYKVLALLFQIGFFIYSGIGLAFYKIQRPYLFLLQYSLGSILFSLVIYILQGNGRVYVERKWNTDEKVFNVNNGLIPKLFAVIYILTFVFPFIYPSFAIDKLFDVGSFFSRYQALTSTYKLSLQTDGLYQLVCSTLRTIAMPWFYVYLFKNKDKPIKFLLIFIIPIYLYAVRNSYVSRNELAVNLVFIYIYLYKEKILSRRTLRIIAIVAIPVFVVAMAGIFYVRVGINISSFTIGDLIRNISTQEINFVQNYNRAAQLSGSFSTIMFFIYVITCFIPMSIRGFFGVQEINMARILSNDVLNMVYGQRDYYLILPSVLGEGIMLFSEYFAFVYMAILGAFLCWFLNRVSRDESLEYLKIYFLIDVFRQLRGGSQFILSTWTASIIPFLFICYLTRQLVLRRQGEVIRKW